MLTPQDKENLMKAVFAVAVQNQQPKTIQLTNDGGPQYALTISKVENAQINFSIPNSQIIAKTILNEIAAFLLGVEMDLVQDGDNLTVTLLLPGALLTKMKREDELKREMELKGMAVTRQSQEIEEKNQQLATLRRIITNIASALGITAQLSDENAEGLCVQAIENLSSTPPRSLLRREDVEVDEPLYQTNMEVNVIETNPTEDDSQAPTQHNLTLRYFDVENTIAAIEQRIVDGLNKAAQPAQSDGDHMPLLFNESQPVTLAQLTNPTNVQYADYQAKIREARTRMEAFNAQTQALRTELEATVASEAAKDNPRFTLENAAKIADAQREMIKNIADSLNGKRSEENRTIEGEIKSQAKTFKKTYNDEFEELRFNHDVKSVGWGVGVGLAMAAVGVGLAFAAFLTLPIFAPEFGLALFSPEFFITLASAATGLGIVSGIGSTISASQNRYAHGDNVRGAASKEKNTAIDTATILAKLDFARIKEVVVGQGISGGMMATSTSTSATDADSNDDTDSEKPSLLDRISERLPKFGQSSSDSDSSDDDRHDTDVTSSEEETTPFWKRAKEAAKEAWENRPAILGGNDDESWEPVV